MDLSQFKLLSDAVANLFTAAALVVGGFWTYLLFVKNRKKFPRAELEHQVVVTNLERGYRLVHLRTVIANEGEVLLSLRNAHSWIQQVVPLPAGVIDKLSANQDPVPVDESEYPWPELGDTKYWNWKHGDAEIEPGETEVLRADFFAGPHVQVVALHSHVGNTAKQNGLGWSESTVLDLRKELKVGRSEGAAALAHLDQGDHDRLAR